MYVSILKSSGLAVTAIAMNECAAPPNLRPIIVYRAVLLATLQVTNMYYRTIKSNSHNQQRMVKANIHTSSEITTCSTEQHPQKVRATPLKSYIFQRRAIEHHNVHIPKERQPKRAIKQKASQ